MNEGLNSDDPDYLKSVEKAPLQDDPTLRATYLIVEPDQTEDMGGYRESVGADRKNKLKNVESAPRWEVGGGYLMINYFKISGWTPQQTSKIDCFTVIGRFTRRLERSIQQMAHNEFAYGITTDDGMETTGGMMQVFNLAGTDFKLVGGESEWYGKVVLHFGIYSQVNHAFWS